MRKRSEINQPSKESKFEEEPKATPTDKRCGAKLADGDVCKLQLFDTPSGLLCHVHGGGPPVLEETVEELSGQLESEIDKAKREIAEHEIDRRPDQWDSANRAQEKPIEPAFGAIIEKIFVEDPVGVYTRLEEQLRVGEERSDRGMLLRALDNAESNARLAHRLFISAKLEQQRYELNNKIVFGAMREAANRVLQREKDQKLRSKQITEDDVESAAARLFPDEYEEQMIRRKKADLLVKSMENLAELWKQRCSSLEVMLGKSR